MNETKSRKILVIGDYLDPEFMQLALSTKLGYIVKIALDYPQGLEMAKQDPPDMIITFLITPLLEGLSVCHELKWVSALQNIPVLIIGGALGEYVYPDAQRVGAAGYLHSPFGLQELSAACEAVLRGETYYPLLEGEPDPKLLARMREAFSRTGRGQ